MKLLQPHPVATIELAGHTLDLLPNRGVYVRDSQLLLIADTHFGKAGIFANAGLPVPRETTDQTLKRIDDMCHEHDVHTICVLGDFWHGVLSPNDPLYTHLQSWRADHAQRELWMVTGNHDRWTLDQLDALSVERLEDEIDLDGLTLRHFPPPDTLPYSESQHSADTAPRAGRKITVCGHLHPMFRLYDVGAIPLRLPCFHLASDRLVLPAIGAFTGGMTVVLKQDEVGYVCLESSIAQITQKTISR